MKTIRYIAALLMLVSGVWHIIWYINPPAEPDIVALAFGILYIITGLLLFTPKMIGVYLGLIPIVPLIMAPFVITEQDKNLTVVTILLIDLIVFVCCVYLVIKGKKKPVH